MNNIVPFGKYKGQPVEVLAADQQYLDWMRLQPWFQEKYPDLYKIVFINHFTEHADTPEHNALQIKFIDDDFLIALTKRLEDAYLRLENEYVTDIQYEVSEKQAEVCGNDFVFRVKVRVTQVYPAIPEYVDDGFEEPQRSPPQPELVSECVNYRTNERRWFFEETEWGKRVRTEGYTRAWNSSYRYRVECKPSVGDDYPAVLREVNAHRGNGDLANHQPIVYCERYDGSIEFAKVRQFFALSGVVFISEDGQL